MSLIIPVYNGEDYVTHILEDLSRQSLANVEFLIIDDGSTDKTASIIKNFVSKIGDRRFKYFYQKNSGVSAARNFGISQSIGEYIMFIDADDSITDDLCQEYISRIIANKTDIEFFPFQTYKRSDKNPEKFDLCGKQLNYGKYSKNAILNSDDIMRLIFNYKIQGYPFGYISKRNLWNADSFDTEVSIAEDLLALVQILIKNKDLRIHINKYGKYRYIVRENSAIHSPFNIEQDREITQLFSEIVNRVSAYGYSERHAKNLLYGHHAMSVRNAMLGNFYSYAVESKKFLTANFLSTKMPFLSRMKRLFIIILILTPNMSAYRYILKFKKGGLI